jgi:hypothetical protein
MPIQGVVRVGCVPSTVGIVPTRLHRSMTHHYQAIRGRREKKKTMTGTGWLASRSVHGADHKDCWHHEMPPHHQPRRPFPRRAESTTGTSCKRGKPFGLWDATGSAVSVQQLVAPSVRPPRHPIWQRPSAWVLGLDGQA